MQRRLVPFTPRTDLALSVLHPIDPLLLGEGEVTDYGFKQRSKQYNFFARPPRGATVVALHEPGASVATLRDPSVVAFLFGDATRNLLRLWYVGVNKAHPDNESGRGTRWGVYGIAPVQQGDKVRWLIPPTTKLTPRNAAAHVAGTPNPYAVECIARAVTHLRCTGAMQHPDMPCTKLFDRQYDHRHHPAVLLLYLALGFQRGMEHYDWYAERDPPLMDALARVRALMARGEAAVVPGPGKDK